MIQSCEMRTTLNMTVNIQHCSTHQLTMKMYRKDVNKKGEDQRNTSGNRLLYHNPEKCSQKRKNNKDYGLRYSFCD